ncbi:MAG: TonB-dependent receptor, partial [Pseudomonadota bacterium]
LFAVYETRDGFLDVVTGPGPRTEDEDGDHEFFSLRGQLRFEPSSDLSINLIGDYTDREENCCLADYESVDPGRGPAVVALAGGVGASAPTDPFDRVAFANRDTDQAVEDWGLSAEIEWNLGFGDLTSITSYRDYSSSLGGDTDYSAADIWYRNKDDTVNEFSTITQEVRLAGATTNIDWLVGLFFAQEDLDRKDKLFYGTQYFDYWNLLFGGALTPFDGAFWNGDTPSQDDRFAQEATTIALFTHNTISLSDAFDLTVGLRFTSDEKDLSTDYNSESASCSTILTLAPSAASVGCLPWSNDKFIGFSTEQSRTDEELSGTLKGSYRLNENILTYVSYARGYKAGGFNLDRAAGGPGADVASSFVPSVDTSFEPETVDAYELGWKTNNDAESLFFNGAIFYQDYSDFQLNTFTGTSFIVTSTPEVTSKGVDLDFRYLPTWNENLTLQGGMTYAETQYGSFDAAAFNAPALLPDRTISFAPRWSGSLAATLNTDFLADWEARWNTSIRYTSKYNTGSNLDPQKDVDELFVVNARAVFFNENSPLSLELWAQNLFDEDYFQVAFDTPLQGSNGSAIASFLSPPQTYGATIKAKF